MASTYYDKGSSQISSGESTASSPTMAFQDSIKTAQAVEGQISSEMSKASSEIVAKRSPIMKGLSIILSLATIGVAVYLLMEMQKKAQTA